MTQKLKLLGVSCLIVLVGCEDLGLGGGANTTAEAPNAVSTRILTGEVERPDVFRQAGNAVWDGRPTLGGTWVASKETDDLERVRITRTDTGESVEGALFRIEPDTPGPGLVISSDAARALGVVAGTPTQIEVVALRDAPLPVAAPVGELEDAETSGEIEETLLEPLPEEVTSDAEEVVPLSDPEAAPGTAPLTTSIPQAIKSGGQPAPVAGNTNSGPRDAVVDPAPVQQTTPQPVLEIGTFATEQEADLALAQLASQGLTAQKERKRNLLGARWTVFAGPFATPTDMIEGRKAAAAAGFDEAVVTVK